EQLRLDPVLLDRDYLASDAHALLQLGRRCACGERVGGELLDTEADALLLGVRLEYHGFGGVALLVVLERLFAGLGPVEIRQVHHAIDPAIEPDEQAELGDVANLALDE